MKLLEEYFTDRPKICNIPFCTDNNIDEEIFNAKVCSVHDLVDLEQLYGGAYPHTYGKVLHVGISSRSDICYALSRLGHFQTVVCKLGFESLRRILRYLSSHTNKPLVFPKHIKRSSTTTIRAFWSRKEYEDITYTNALAGHQDTGFAADKILRSSYAGMMHTMLGTVISWKVKRLLLTVNSTDGEVRILYLSLLKTKKI